MRIKMKTISKTVYEVQLRELNKRKIWRVIESDNNNTDFIGEIALCGLPRASFYPIGSKYTAIVQVPE